MSHRRPSSTGPRGLRNVRALALVAMFPAVLAGPYPSALAIDCSGSGQIDEFVTSTLSNLPCCTKMTVSLLVPG